MLKGLEMAANALAREESGCYAAVSTLLLFIIFKANTPESHVSCLMWIKVFAAPGDDRRAQTARCPRVADGNIKAGRPLLMSHPALTRACLQTGGGGGVGGRGRRGRKSQEAHP